MKRFGRTGMGIVLALGLLGVVPGTVLAAQPSCGAILMANTTLTADLDCSGHSGDGLSFGKSRITLNLNGHTLTGPAGYDDYGGVHTRGYNFVTVTNGTIANYTYGVYNNESSSSRFTWLTITGENDGSDYGIYASYGAGNIYNHLDISNVDIGMNLEFGASNKIKNSTAAGTDVDFNFWFESTDLIKNNKAQGEGYGFYDYYGGHNKYVGNTANGHNYTGFYLYCDGYAYVTLLNNTANGNGVIGLVGDGEGFTLYYCYDFFGGEQGSLVQGNTAKNNGGNGFEDHFSVNSLWQYNLAKGNTSDGFYLDYPELYVIRYNRSIGNGGSGFSLDHSQGPGYSGPFRSTFSYNTARYNDDYGFYADYGQPGKGNYARRNGTNCYNVVCI